MRALLLVSTVVVLGLLSAAVATVEPEEPGVVLLVNVAFPIANPCPLREIKDIYLGNLVAKNGIRLMPINRKDPELLRAFLKTVLSMSLGPYKSHWVKKALSEGGNAPKIVDGSEALLKLLAENKGAIGYAAKGEAVKTEGVKVLLIADSCAVNIP